MNYISSTLSLRFKDKFDYAMVLANVALEREPNLVANLENLG